MQTYRMLATALLLAALAGCGSTQPSGPTPALAHDSSSAPPSASVPTNAIALCRASLATHTVISGTWTTVGEVRRWIRGGVQNQGELYPLLAAFPGVAPTEPAAWCWTRDQPHSDGAWVARPDVPAIHAITIICQGCQGADPMRTGAPPPIP